MSIEAINVVVAAENAAEKLRGNALVEARGIVADAEAAGKDKVQKAVKSAESQVQAFYREAEKQGKEIAAKTASKVKDECLSLEKKAEAKMDKAVAIIMERVVSRQ